MLEPHTHNGINSPRIKAEDLLGHAIIAEDIDTGVSALRAVQPSIMQRGFYTLAANVKFVAFPQPYSEVTTLQVLLTPDTANQQFLQGIVVSGFTVSGSGTDTGHWLSLGYK